jgi:hypothetical protein
MSRANAIHCSLLSCRFSMTRNKIPVVQRHKLTHLKANFETRISLYRLEG